ncbi:hypothetical protein BASA81_000878 [Batrachochytrium salamandrivorans]|nr:hypothetical protein BASA81_000878 [Batrachochytrium salamandrivorans]
MNKFIRSAYEMAMDEHANGAGMGFSADGLSLELRDLDVLSTRLRKYFNHNKVSSFCRQLNNYGFKKLVPTRSAKSVMDGKRLAMTTGEEVPSLQVFVHPCFQRNRPDLCCQIRRQASGPRRPRPTNAAAAATATTASASDDEEDEDEDEDAATSSANTSNNSATIDHLLELNANLRKHNIDLLRELSVSFGTYRTYLPLERTQNKSKSCTKMRCCANARLVLALLLPLQTTR